jgi:uncharacterized membrane protein (DUF106 family)
MTGAALFLVFFLLIAPTTRNIVTHMLGQSGDWITNWAPFSYVLLALVGVAAVFATYLMMKWPKVEEPVNPMAKYRNEVIDDD